MAKSLIGPLSCDCKNACVFHSRQQIWRMYWHNNFWQQINILWLFLIKALNRIKKYMFLYRNIYFWGCSILNMPWTQVSASFSLILCSAVILNYSKGMVLQLHYVMISCFFYYVNCSLSTLRPSQGFWGTRAIFSGEQWPKNKGNRGTRPFWGTG